MPLPLSMHADDTSPTPTDGGDVRAVRRALPKPYRRQPEFGELVGRSPSTVSAYENGHRPVPAGVASACELLSGLLFLSDPTDPEALDSILAGALAASRLAGAEDGAEL